MFDILARFIVFPFVAAFMVGFFYYGLWKLIKPNRSTSETAP